jgi:tetratricopeptide (TPR) repeat protein
MMQLAENYEKNKQYTKAIYMYNSILDMQPDNFDIYQKLGSLYTRTGDSKKANEILQMSKSRNIVNIVEKGTLAKQSKPEKQEVINSYIASLQDDYLNIQKHLSLLSVYEWYGMEDAALDEYYTIFAI